MDRLGRFVFGRIIGDDADLRDQQVRARVGFLEAWVSIGSNLVLAAVKLAFGFLLNSISLLADAVHTASDVLTSAVVLIGFRTAQMPADEEHPYGHGRVETIATVVIAMLLILAGLQFAGSSARRLLSGTAVGGSFLVAGLLVGGGIFKEWLARFSEALGRRIGSSTLAADAWHHRTDAIASGLVAVAMVASYYGHHRVDAILGLAVSGLIVYAGWQLGKGAADELIGRGAAPDVVSRIEEAAAKVPGVRGVHNVCAHDYGAGQVLVSLHIQVDQRLRVDESHGIAENVEKILLRDMGLQSTVHVEPHP